MQTKKTKMPIRRWNTPSLDRLGSKYKHSKAFVQKQDEKNYETEVLRRQQGIENARNERELRESQDQRQNSFITNFESGELVH
jgi:hypothetical protein